MFVICYLVNHHPDSMAFTPARLGAIDYRLVDDMVDPSGAWDRWKIGWKTEDPSMSQRFLFLQFEKVLIYFTGGFKLFQIWLMFDIFQPNWDDPQWRAFDSICFRAQQAVVHGEVGHDSALQWGTGESPGVRRSALAEIPVIGKDDENWSFAFQNDPK